MTRRVCSMTYRHNYSATCNALKALHAAKNHATTDAQVKAFNRLINQLNNELDLRDDLELLHSDRHCYELKTATDLTTAEVVDMYLNALV